MVRRIASLALLITMVSGCAVEVDSSAPSESAQPITSADFDSGDLGVAALVRDGEIVCSAALVSPDSLLTAAHCLIPGPAPTYAFFGTSANDSQRVDILDTIGHPDFDPITRAHDIALLRLSRKAPVPDSAVFALAPRGNAIQQGATLRIVGFGAAGGDDTRHQ